MARKNEKSKKTQFPELATNPSYLGGDIYYDESVQEYINHPIVVAANTVCDILKKQRIAAEKRELTYAPLCNTTGSSRHDSSKVAPNRVVDSFALHCNTTGSSLRGSSEVAPNRVLDFDAGSPTKLRKCFRPKRDISYNQCSTATPAVKEKPTQSHSTDGATERKLHTPYTGAAYLESEPYQSSSKDLYAKSKPNQSFSEAGSIESELYKRYFEAAIPKRKPNQSSSKGSHTKTLTNQSYYAASSEELSNQSKKLNSGAANTKSKPNPTFSVGSSIQNETHKLYSGVANTKRNSKQLYNGADSVESKLYMPHSAANMKGKPNQFSFRGSNTKMKPNQPYSESNSVESKLYMPHSGAYKKGKPNQSSYRGSYTKKETDSQKSYSGESYMASKSHQPLTGACYTKVESNYSNSEAAYVETEPITFNAATAHTKKKHNQCYSETGAKVAHIKTKANQCTFGAAYTKKKPNQPYLESQPHKFYSGDNHTKWQENQFYSRAAHRARESHYTLQNTNQMENNRPILDEDNTFNLLLQNTSSSSDIYETCNEDTLLADLNVEARENVAKPSTNYYYYARNPSAGIILRLPHDPTIYKTKSAEVWNNTKRKMKNITASSEPLNTGYSDDLDLYSQADSITIYSSSVSSSDDDSRPSCSVSELGSEKNLFDDYKDFIYCKQQYMASSRRASV